MAEVFERIAVDPRQCGGPPCELADISACLRFANLRLDIRRWSREHPARRAAIFLAEREANAVAMTKVHDFVVLLQRLGRRLRAPCGSP